MDGGMSAVGMSHAQVLVPEDTRNVFLLLLTVAAGSIDALSLLGLGNVFVSALSGNTVLLGAAMINGRFDEAILCATVFFGFVPGAVLGAFLLRSPPKGSQWTKRVTDAMIVEAVALFLFVTALFMIGDGQTVEELVPLILLPAFAMGLQYMTMLRLNIKGVTTIFVTSTVINLVCRMVVPDESQQEMAKREGERRSPWSDRSNRLLAAIWTSYFIGALIGAALIGLGRGVAGSLSFLLVTSIVVYSLMHARSNPLEY